MKLYSAGENRPSRLGGIHITFQDDSTISFMPTKDWNRKEVICEQLTGTVLVGVDVQSGADINGLSLIGVNADYYLRSH